MDKEKTDLLAGELMDAAVKVGRYMAADMAEQAAKTLSEQNDHHGAATLQEFAYVLRKVD